MPTSTSATSTDDDVIESREDVTPAAALRLLKEGNQRFLNGSIRERDLDELVRRTATGQSPFAFVLGCIDSRVLVETIFDQGIGDIFTARIAGNVVNTDLLGSMEFACALVGAKAIVVLGHTACGAVDGAIRGVRLGHLSDVLARVEPAVAEVEQTLDREDEGFATAVVEANVRHSVDAIRAQSAVLAELEAKGAIAIAGAVYDVSTGAARFL